MPLENTGWDEPQGCSLRIWNECAGVALQGQPFLFIECTQQLVGWVEQGRPDLACRILTPGGIASCRLSTILIESEEL